jgi:hypothetical protein
MHKVIEGDPPIWKHWHGKKKLHRKVCSMWHTMDSNEERCLLGFHQNNNS